MDGAAQSGHLFQSFAGGEPGRIDGQHLRTQQIHMPGHLLHILAHGGKERQTVINSGALLQGNAVLPGKGRQARPGGIDKDGVGHGSEAGRKGGFHGLRPGDGQGMGEGKEAEMGQLRLSLPQGDVVHQMPALVQNVVEDAHIHILQMADKVLGNGVGLLIESGMHRAGRGGVIPPMDGLSV